MAQHILPIDDDRPHECSARCACKPDVEIHQGEVYVVHNYFAEIEFWEKLLGSVCLN